MPKVTNLIEEENSFSKLRIPILFVVIVIIVSGFAWYAMSFSNETLQRNHNIILSHHRKFSELTDSLISLAKVILQDSLIKQNEKIAVYDRLENVFTSLANEDDEKSTSRLLELEFSKIQNEYEVLNLWCALLTVVFLIFSFFSIFKTNEMSNQGEEALRQLRKTAHEAKTKSDDIDIKIEEAEQKIKHREKELKKSLEDEINSLQNELNKCKVDYTELNNSINSCTEKETDLKNRIAGINSDVENIVSAAKSEINNKISEVVERKGNAFIQSKDLQIVRLSSEVEELKKLIIKIQSSNTSIASEERENEEEDDAIDLESESEENEEESNQENIRDNSSTDNKNLL